MNELEKMEEQAQKEGIILDYRLLRKTDQLDGLYMEWDEGPIIITINQYRSTSIQTIAMAEELGHFYQSSGNALGDSVTARKQEQYGRNWCYEHLLPVDKLNRAIKSGAGSLWEIADWFGLHESFVRDALVYYRRKSSGVCSAMNYHWCYLA